MWQRKGRPALALNAAMKIETRNVDDLLCICVKLMNLHAFIYQRSNEYSILFGWAVACRIKLQTYLVYWCAIQLEVGWFHEWADQVADEMWRRALLLLLVVLTCPWGFQSNTDVLGFM